MGWIMNGIFNRIDKNICRLYKRNFMAEPTTHDVEYALFSFRAMFFGVLPSNNRKPVITGIQIVPFVSNVLNMEIDNA